MCAWRVASRGPSAEVPVNLPQVTVRRASFAYNKHLRDAARLDDFQKVTFHIDDDEHRIGLRFHNNERDENAYAVHFDGGSSGRKGQTVRTKRIYATQCNHIINSTPWLKKISQLEDPAFRRFIARLDERENLWILQLGRRLRGRQKHPTKSHPIYAASIGMCTKMKSCISAKGKSAPVRETAFVISGISIGSNTR